MVISSESELAACNGATRDEPAYRRLTKNKILCLHAHKAMPMKTTRPAIENPTMAPTEALHADASLAAMVAEKVPAPQACLSLAPPTQ